MTFTKALTESFRFFFFSGVSLILIVWYWIIGAIYSFFDLTLKPESLRKYKIQPGHNEPLDRNRFIQVG